MAQPTKIGNRTRIKGP